MVLIKHLLMVHYLHGGPDQGLSVLLDFAVSISPQTETPPSLSSRVTPPPLFLLNMQSGWRSRSSASTPPTSTTSTTTSPTTAQYAEWRATAGRCRSIQIKPDLSLPRKFPPNSFQQNSRIQNKTQNTRKSTNQIRYGSVLNIIIDIVICFIRRIFLEFSQKFNQIFT